MNFMGIGVQEMIIVLVAALVIFGPDRLPEVAGQVGKAIRDLRKMATDLTGEIERTAGVGDIKKAVQSELAGIQRELGAVTGSAQATMSGAASSVNSTVSSSKTASSTSTFPAATSSTTTSASNGSSASGGAKPTASKRDPLADLSFFEEPAAPVTLPASAQPKPSVTVPSPSPTIDQLDAVGRARQRRAAAGYNRLPLS